MWRCGEMQSGKSMKSWAQMHLSVSLLVGVLLLLLTYLVFSQQQFAISARNGNESFPSHPLSSRSSSSPAFRLSASVP